MKIPHFLYYLVGKKRFIKDLYQILEIEPKATTEEIKKAFRRLAHEFHPDKNPDNPFAETRFRSVQEAYAILTNPEKRADYDHERWLSGRFSKKTVIITPEYLNTEVIKLMDHLSALDVYRMNKQLLHEYLLFLLQDEKLAIINLKATEAQVEHFTTNLITITKLLPFYYALPVLNRLQVLTDTQVAIAPMVKSELAKRFRERKLQKLTPWLVLTIVLVLLITMYLYSKR